jgi:ATP-dependent Zn protease
VTIIRHGSALGITAWKPNEEKHTQTKEELLARIRVSLGSRAAEQLFLGVEMTGAHHDLQTATAVADAGIRHFGMNGSLYQPTTLGEITPDARSKKEIERLLEQQFKMVKSMLDENRDEVHAVAERLLDAEELTGDEVQEILVEVGVQRRYALNGKNGLHGANGAATDSTLIAPPSAGDSL